MKENLTVWFKMQIATNRWKKSEGQIIGQCNFSYKDIEMKAGVKKDDMTNTAKHGLCMVEHKKKSHHAHIVPTFSHVAYHKNLLNFNSITVEIANIFLTLTCKNEVSSSS